VGYQLTERTPREIPLFLMRAGRNQANRPQAEWLENSGSNAPARFTTCSIVGTFGSMSLKQPAQGRRFYGAWTRLAQGPAGWCMRWWAIMRNHFHAALETPEPNLVSGMQWLQTTFCARFSRLAAECRQGLRATELYAELTTKR
jgi:hypothetical protein